jgi:uncharacterized protein (TIGR02145 family)
VYVTVVQAEDQPDQGVIILSKSSPNLTVSAGSQASVYGTAVANDITLESGAKADLVNFPGSNSIKFQSDSNLFTVSRSGSIVTFQGSDGTELKMPATDSVQTISFAAREPLTLSLYQGQVMLDDQVITTTPVYLGNPELSVNPTSRNVDSESGTTTFSVSNTGVDTMAWTAEVTSGGDWLTIISGESGSDSGTISCQYDANVETDPRTGVIRITATGASGSPMDVTVTQQAHVSCSYSISPTSGSFSADGESKSISVTPSSSNCNWTTSESLSWVSLSSATGTGSGSVTVSVDPNTGDARSGSVTIAGKTYSINQDGAGFSTLGATVIDLRFFETGDTEPPPDQRTFATSFSQGSTRRVHYHLWLEYPPPATRVDFTLTIRYYKPDGSLLSQFEQHAYVEPTWTTGSSHSFGWGWTSPGNWPVGTYTVGIFDGATEIARGAFSINENGEPDECGAYIAPGVWKEFDCYNLAAIGKITGADPFTPSWELNGGYWQWGRKGPDPDQEDWYNTNTEHFAYGPTGPGESEANSGSINDWDQSYAPNGSWSDSQKTANDPCPSGFRVPTKTEWDGVLNNNTQCTVGSWSYSATNYSSARFFGDDLMLPAAGLRYFTSGALGVRGYDGRYWGSSESSSSLACNLYFDGGSADTYDYGRLFGFSVRCISE